MKAFLITPSGISQDYIIVPPRVIDKIKALVLGLPSPPDIKFPGRVVFSDCEIDFETTPIVLGQKIDRLVFGSLVYLGVTPVEQISSSIFKCLVDCMDNIPDEESRSR